MRNLAISVLIYRLYIKGSSFRGSNKLLNTQVQCNPKIRGTASEGAWTPDLRLSYILPKTKQMPGKFQYLAANFFKGLTQNSTRKLKVEIQFNVDSENFMKKYWNPIEFYCYERNQFWKYRELRYVRFCSYFAIIWAHNPQLSIYWADIHRECVVEAYLSYKVCLIQNIDNWPIYRLKYINIGAYAQIWSYSIFLITQPVFIQL